MIMIILIKYCIIFFNKTFKLSTIFLTQNLVSTFDIPLTKYFEKAKTNKIKPFFFFTKKIKIKIFY